MAYRHGEAANVIKFSRDGKYIGKIGSKGNGPGEYISADALCTDESHVYIYDRMQRSVIRDDHNGNYNKKDSIGAAEDLQKKNHLGLLKKFSKICRMRKFDYFCAEKYALTDKNGQKFIDIQLF